MFTCRWLARHSWADGSRSDLPLNSSFVPPRTHSAYPLEAAQTKHLENDFIYLTGPEPSLSRISFISENSNPILPGDPGPILASSFMLFFFLHTHTKPSGNLTALPSGTSPTLLPFPSATWSRPTSPAWIVAVYTILFAGQRESKEGPRKGEEEWHCGH